MWGEAGYTGKDIGSKYINKIPLILSKPTQSVKKPP
jgi:hypothetical protein